MDDMEVRFVQLLDDLMLLTGQHRFVVRGTRPDGSALFASVVAPTGTLATRKFQRRYPHTRGQEAAIQLN